MGNKSKQSTNQPTNKKTKMQSKIIETIAVLSATMAALGQANELLGDHPLAVYANKNCQWKEGKEWLYTPGDDNGLTQNGITYLWFSEQGVEDYSEGTSFIVPAGMNVKVFASNFAGTQRVVPGSTTWNQCQALGQDFAWRVSTGSSLMVIPDSLFTHEPETTQTSDACQIDEAINMFGANRCVDHSECSGARTCSPNGRCQGTSGCPEACEVDEAINSMGPNRCDSDIQCAGARTCSSDGWCEGDSGCGQDHHRMLANTCSYDESKNTLGPKRCTTSFECTGVRKCFGGYCIGFSGCDDPCSINEALNTSGPNRCSYDDECAGARTCSPLGWCMGNSGCRW